MMMAMTRPLTRPSATLAPLRGARGWSLDIPFERHGQRSVQLHAVAGPRNGAWRLSAAVGGTRSIAPGFSRVETGQIELSPCSGRQAAEVPWTTRTSAWVEVLVDVSLSPATRARFMRRIVHPAEAGCYRSRAAYGGIMSKLQSAEGASEL